MRPVAFSVRLFEAVLFCVFNQRTVHDKRTLLCFFRIYYVLHLYSFVVYLTELLLLSHYIVLIYICGMTTLSGIGKYVLGSAVVYFNLLPRHLSRANEKYQEAFPTHMYNNLCFGQN